MSVSSSQKLKNLAAALSPADVRVGGTYSDFLNFDPISDDANCVEVTAPGKKSTEELDFTLSGKSIRNDKSIKDFQFDFVSHWISSQSWLLIPMFKNG